MSTKGLSRRYRLVLTPSNLKPYRADWTYGYGKTLNKGFYVPEESNNCWLEKLVDGKYIHCAHYGWPYNQKEFRFSDYPNDAFVGIDGDYRYVVRMGSQNCYYYITLNKGVASIF